MIFGGLAVQHQALMRRNLQFGRLAAIEILSILAGVAMAVLMARQGWSYWSLVGMTAATTASAAVLSFLFSGWIPGLPVRGSGVRPMLHVGGSLSAASLIGYFGRTGDSLIVGQWFGAQPVGLYNRAMVLLLAPWYQFVHPIHCVLEPALCRVRFEPGRFKDLYQQYLSLSAAVTIPTTIVLALNSQSIVRIVLGEAWMDVVPIFVALFPAALAAGLRPGIGWLFTPLGRPHLHLRFTAVSTPVVFLACLIGARFSPAGVAAGLSLSQALLFVIGVEYGVRDTFLRRRDVWLCILPSALAAGAGTLVFFAVAPYSEWLASALLLVCSLALTIVLQSAWNIPSVWAHAAQRLAEKYGRWTAKNELINEGIAECP
jgi:PST family polysaccharide transporter